jgi:hypothetical protein
MGYIRIKHNGIHQNKTQWDISEYNTMGYSRIKLPIQVVDVNERADICRQ